MKRLPILIFLTSPSLTTALHPRAINPQTLNPTHLSLLSVLKTAMPTDPNTPLPTGDFEPEWYADLPGDVKSLLPELYPATQGGGGEMETSVREGEATGEEEVLSTSYSEVLTAIVTAGSSSSSSMVALDATATAIAIATATTTADGTVVPTGSQNTSPSSSTGSSESVSAGARTIKMEGLATVVWFCVGAGFSVFA